MALTFERVLPVQKGKKVLSSQHNNLARSINDRFRAFQFCAWRCCMYHMGLWRQFRNPSDGGFVFPSQAEAFDIYHHMDPEFLGGGGGTTYPVTDPGEAEGANLANPINQFTFGVDPVLDSEDIRLSNRIVPEVDPSLPPKEAVWELGKAERGSYDPLNGAQTTPAFDAAQDFRLVTQPFWSPHGKSYGGFFPTPVELLPDCGASDSTGLGIPSYEIFFTGLRADVSTAGFHGTPGVNGDGLPTMTYAGTCACGYDSFGAGHVIGYVVMTTGVMVAVATGDPSCAYDLDFFTFTDWIEGPYTNAGRLSHADGGQLLRAINAFAQDFRGTDAQRTPDTFRIAKIALDEQRFNTRQYYLSPNIGTLIGDVLLASYPTATFAGKYIGAGTLGSFAGEGKEHVYTDGFVIAGVFAKASKLYGDALVEVLDDDEVIHRFTLTGDTDGDAEYVKFLEVCPTPKPLKIRMANNATFKDSSGQIVVQATEQLDYKPQFWDAYLLARLSATKGGTALLGSGVDGRGRDCDFAKQITDDYFANGCIASRFTSGVRDIAEWINDTPVYDSARRMTRDSVRITRKEHFVSYEVPGDGTCVFRFRRFAFGLNNQRADMFHNIAPPIDPVVSGDLLEGETYVVRGTGKITYNGSSYSQGQTFTTTNKADFQVVGSAQVFVHDGIRHTALKKGFSNEWVFFLEGQRYHPSPTSIWKEEAVADYYAFSNRCHFYSGTAPASLRRHFSYNHTTTLDGDFMPVLNPIGIQAQFYAPEAPDQYNYTAGANRLFGNDSFYSSCRVYEAPYEIQSCVVETWNDDIEQPGDQIIKLTLKTRLRSHPDAPSTVNKDPSTWSTDEKAILRNEYVTDPDVNEDYRTDDNLIREFALKLATTNKECTVKVGDSGTGSAVDGLTDNPFGCCYPHFFIKHLAPLVYEDNNNTLDSHDTRVTIDAYVQMEADIRAMCEGFVDARTSQDIICAQLALDPLYQSTVFEFKFENLCFQAFRGRFIGAFSLLARPDQPAGFGPLPNTKIYADVFNRYVECVNLLNKIRLDIPVQFSFTTDTYSGEQSANPTLCNGTTSCSDTVDAFAFLDGGSAPGANTFVGSSGVTLGTAFNARQSATLDGCPFKLVTQRTQVNYHAEVNPLYVNAIPPALQELVDLGQTAFMATVTTEIVNEKRFQGGAGTGDRCDPSIADQWKEAGNPSNVFHWLFDVNTTVVTCALVSSGTLNAPSVLSCDYRYGYSATKPGKCLNGPSSSVTIELLAEQGAIVQIPLA